MPPKSQKRVIKQIGMREHIKKRSMWAGSKSTQSVDMYNLVVEYDKYSKKNIYTFEPTVLKFPPALFKCVDEIVVNAIDHFVSYPKLVKNIKITIDTKGVISVYNDGPGIHIERTNNIHGKEMYTPQLIFSEMLAGSNLDDDEEKERIVGGQNGLGAKITAVFSEYFTVETADIETNQHYVQTFRDGLETIEEPVVMPYKKKTSYTKITFLPDYNEFKIDITKLYETLYKIIQARAWQAAAYTGINIYFNEEIIPLNGGFASYCAMFSEFEIFPTTMTKKDGKFEWEVCIGLTDGKERQLSMVNGVFIQSGGTHIKHIQNHLVENLKGRIEKELKKTKTKFNKNLLLNNLFIFMKGAIPNPEFLSQTKDAISSPIELFESYSIPESHWAKIWRLVEPAVMASFLKKQLGNVKLRANRGKIDVPKYREANYCRDSKLCHQCGLIITEGDSATGTAKTGLLSNASPYFNYDWFGTYSIQGVPMNTLKESVELKKKTKTQPAKKGDAKTDTKSPNKPTIVTTRIPSKKVLDNERFTSLMLVLGLDYNKNYDTEKELNTLRYKFIVGLTDQDLDGFNIFGLLCTFFITYWPNLVKHGFIRRIYTPLIRAIPKNRKRDKVVEFYTENAAREWTSAIGENVVRSTYTLKYYKGLGSHKEAFKEVTQMFTNIEDKLCTYVLDALAITNMDTYYGIDTKPRKIALANAVYAKNVVGLELPMSQQFTTDSKMYQRDNILRKLLSAIDGFVGSRRKVFYTARKVGNREIKVQGLAGETVAKANYHHGEASLEQTIVRMAQAFPGARNLPLLQPLGNFGSRDKGYKDFAASRYIYTTINHRLADKLFRKEDEFILEYEIEDGVRYEPKYYVPVIPYALCENNQLPATGWAICIQARHIDHIFKNVRAMINGQPKCKKLPMWNKHFRGDIRTSGTRKYFVGKYEFDDSANTIHISELPPMSYSHGYLKGTDKAVKKSEDKQGIQTKEWVNDFTDETNMDGVNITIYLKDGAFDAINESHGSDVFDCFEEYFELKEPIYNRINLINEQHEVVEYKSYEEVFDDWFKFRKRLYAVRIDREIVVNNLLIKMLREMQSFSKHHDDYAITSKTSEEKAISIIRTNKYNVYNKSLLENPRYMSIDELKLQGTSEEYGASYNYLLGMSYRDLTENAHIKRADRIDKLEERQLYLMDDSGLFPGANMWLKELDELETAIVDGDASDWFYGENIYDFEDASVTDGNASKANAAKINKTAKINKVAKVKANKAAKTNTTDKAKAKVKAKTSD
jgi:DNA topoisomerase-2